MRLLVHVEGQTEEMFVEQALKPHLLQAGYTDVTSRLIGNAPRRAGRGGSRPWPSVRKEILRHLKADQGAISTTMVDYYGMPQWPGRTEANFRPFAQKAEAVQEALARDVRSGMGRGFHRDRFIPYVSMHEFEALLFSDCGAFAQIMGVPEAALPLKAVLARFGDPEQINDSKETKPAARIQSVIKGYDKVNFGPLAIQEIGLDVVRSQCRNFGYWLTRLEKAVE